MDITEQTDDFYSTHNLETLAEAQGVHPVRDPSELLGDFWPEDESVEDFIATLREWRHGGG